MPKEFADYRVNVTIDPVYYGSTVSVKEAGDIAYKLAQLIADEFPGIVIDYTMQRITVFGPDAGMCHIINGFIELNWHDACQY